MQRLLHLINQDLNTHLCQVIAERVQEKDVLVFIEQGVHAIKHPASIPHGIEAYILIADLDAQGLDSTQIPAPFMAIDYMGVVNLLLDCHASLSW